MKRLVVTSLAAIALAFILSSVLARKRVPKPIIQVYYETLCGDSRRFITRQLYPLAKSSLGEHFYFDLIPYGKASTRESGDSYTFDCQHGPNECSGNKVHACAIKHLFPNDTLTLEFVHCSMSSTYPPQSLNACSEKLGIRKDAIETCALGTEGSELLAKNGERTHSLKPRLNFIPWITISGIYNERNFEESLTNLKAVVCRTLLKEGTTPDACDNVEISDDTSGSVSWLVHQPNSTNALLTITFLLVYALFNGKFH